MEERNKDHGIILSLDVDEDEKLKRDLVEKNKNREQGNSEQGNPELGEEENQLQVDTTPISTKGDNGYNIELSCLRSDP